MIPLTVGLIAASATMALTLSLLSLFRLKRYDEAMGEFADWIGSELGQLDARLEAAEQNAFHRSVVEDEGIYDPAFEGVELDDDDYDNSYPE